MTKGKHCDDYIDDATAPACLRAYLAVARAPAHGLAQGGPPPLYATLKHDSPARDVGGVSSPLKAGQRVRVVMASCFGDVGVTPRLDDKSGYSARLAIHELENFAETP